MTKPQKFARCHSDRLNYFCRLCQECYQAKMEGRCLHFDRKRDKHGRCSTCMSNFYYSQRKKGVGDSFGTPRSSQHLREIADPLLRKMLVVRKRRLKYYNLTLEDYDRMLVKQAGVCAICKQLPLPGRDLCVDHDHRCCPIHFNSCGSCVRGLLCHGCNMRIGQVESSLLAKTLAYLIHYRGQTDKLCMALAGFIQYHQSERKEAI